jgi:polar amino acid transport system substrate-binding protein
VIVDLPVAADAVEKQGGVKVVEEIPLETPELFGFAVAKDNTALLDGMNEALVKIKDDGTLTDLYQQYFQTDPPASVLEGTTAPAAG